MEFKTLRQKLGTQEEAAKLFNVNKYCIAKGEAGENMPKTKDLPRIAKACGVSVDELIKSFPMMKRGKRI